MGLENVERQPAGRPRNQHASNERDELYFTGEEGERDQEGDEVQASCEAYGKARWKLSLDETIV